MTIASHELALFEINTGSRYERHCAIARQSRATIQSESWARIASDAARGYQREFGSYNDPIFSTVDLLLCAVELAEYYAQHIAEMDSAT